MIITDDLIQQFGPKIIARVIRIIDDHTIIINTGTAELEKGTLVEVYEYLGILKDLDGTILGTLEYVKGTFKVIKVEENYSFCSTVSETKSILALSPLLEKTYNPPMTVNEGDIEPLSPQERSIHVGDPVKLA